MSAQSEQKPAAQRQQHGLYELAADVRQRAKSGLPIVDGNSRVGRALARWRGSLIRDLGGDVSAQQATLIDLAVRTKLMVDHIDGWLLKQRSIINRRKRTLYPVVMQRQTLADSLARYLKDLGLERRTKGTLGKILSEGPDGSP